MIALGIFFLIIWLFLAHWVLFLVLALGLILFGVYMNFVIPRGPTGYRRRWY